jgi:hypothetical protein
MTKVILNGTIKGLRGRIGNLIFRQLPDGTTLMTEAPPKKNSRQKKRAKLKRSAAQNEHSSRFRDAIFYAKGSQNHAVYTELAACRRHAHEDRLQLCSVRLVQCAGDSLHRAPEGAHPRAGYR